MEEKSFGNILKNLREDTGLSITALAKAADISRPYLSQLESSTRNPAPKTLKKLAEALGNVTYPNLLDVAGYKDLAKQEQLRSAYEDFATKEQFLELFDRVKILEQTIDIKNFLELKFNDLTSEPIYPLYNGHELTRTDRQRILNVLEELFPNYHDLSVSFEDITENPDIHFDTDIHVTDPVGGGGFEYVSEVEIIQLKIRCEMNYENLVKEFFFKMDLNISLNEDKTQGIDNSDLSEFHSKMESLKIPHYNKEYIENELGGFILETAIQYIDEIEF